MIPPICLVHSDINSTQYCPDPMLFLAEPAARLPPARVAERAEEHVPDGQVGVIETVGALLMMHAMALGALHDEAQPVGRLHIPVMEGCGDEGNGVAVSEASHSLYKLRETQPVVSAYSPP